MATNTSRSVTIRHRRTCLKFGRRFRVSWKEVTRFDGSNSQDSARLIGTDPTELAETSRILNYRFRLRRSWRRPIPTMIAGRKVRR